MQKIFMSFVILLIAADSTNAQSQPVNIIRIIEARNFKDPVINWKNNDDVATYYADLARHKHHEVNVYRIPYPTGGSGYKVNYYQVENDSIKNHGFELAEKGQVYNKAEYTWNKDTLNIHLFNENAKSEMYKGYGWGRTSSIKTD